MALPGFLALLFFFSPAPALFPQDELESVIDRMQSIAPREPLAWRTRTVARLRDFTVEKGYEVRCLHHPAGGVQLRFDVLYCMPAVENKSLMTEYNRSTLVFTPSGVSLSFSVVPLEDGKPYEALPHLLVRAERGSASHSAIDPRLVSRAFPAFLYHEEPVATYQCAPRLMFSHEPGLRLLGRRTVQERDCHVLESVRESAELLSRLPDCWYMARRAVKRFYVDAETSLLQGIDQEIDVVNEYGMPERRVYRHSVVRRQNVAGLDFPAVTSMATKNYREGREIPDSDFVHTVEITPFSPASPEAAIRDWADSDPLAADLALVDAPVPPEEASEEEKVRAWLQRAFHRAAWLWIPRAVHPPERDLKPDVLEALREVVRRRPDSWMASAGVLSLERKSSASPIPSSTGEGPVPPMLALLMARNAMSRGEAEAALSVLAAVSVPWDPDLRTDLALTEMRARALLGDLEGLLACADRRLSTSSSLEESLHFLHHAVEGVGSLDPAALRKLDAAKIEEALRKRSGTPAGDVALATWHAFHGRAKEELELLAAVSARESGAHPLLRQWRVASCWRLLGADVRISIPCQTDPRLGAVGPEDRPGRSILSSDRGRVEAVRRLLEPLPDPGAQELFLLGFACYKLRDDTAMGEAFRKLFRLAEAQKLDPNPVHIRAFNHLCGEIGRVARQIPDPELLGEAARIFLDLKYCCNPGIEYSHLESVNVASLYARWLLSRKRHEEVYRVLARAGPTHLMQSEELRRALSGSLPAPALADLILPGLKDLTEFETLEQVILQFYDSFPVAARVLEAGRALAADRPELLFRLARHHGRSGDFGKAASAARAALEAKGKLPPEAEEAAALYLARLETLLGRPLEARQVLDTLRSGRECERLTHLAQGYEEAGDVERALELYLESMKPERGAAFPSFPLGCLYYRSGKFEEALRWFNREVEKGTRVLSWPPDEELPPRSPDPERPRSGPDGRARVLEKLGTDYFIDRFVADLGASPPDVRERVRELAGLWDSEDGEDRRKAAAGLKSLDVTAAEALHRALATTGDADLKSLLREILSRWSEPR